MNIPNIGLIGAGALGSRHLQALALSDRPLNIVVSDPSEASLQIAEELFYQVNGASRHIITFGNDMAHFPEKFDVVIIATSSNVRRALIEKLIGKCSVKTLILEKVLFQKLEDYELIKELLTKNDVKAWVNCPRRMLQFYNTVREQLKEAASFEFSVSGSSWGLGCNTIHFIDLIDFLAGKENLKVDISGLDEHYINSKRQGFLEITGTISGSMGKCKNYSITSYLQEGCPGFLQINSDKVKYMINEGSKRALVAEASNNWEWTEMTYEVPYQSQLTHLVVQDILDTGNCCLTDYETSRYLHVKLLEQLVPYFEKLGVEGKLCPIT